MTNIAHSLLSDLENDIKVTIITQNFDALHEEARSKNVILSHGQMSKARSISNDYLIYDIGDKTI